MHVMRQRVRTFAGVAAFAAVVVAWSAPGCKKEKESLILVDLQAIDGNATAVTDVTITVSKPTGDQVVAPIFDLSGGLPMTPDRDADRHRGRAAGVRL